MTPSDENKTITPKSDNLPLKAVARLVNASPTSIRRWVAKIDFPEPHSPTTETVSFYLIFKSIFFKTLILSLPVWYLRFIFFNLRRVFMNKTIFIKILIIFLVHINASAIEKVVLFGDSLMAGYGLPKEHHLSIVLENNLKEAGLNIKVINGSVSGSTSSGGLNRVDWSLSEPGIDLIILGLGANDMLRGIQPDETKKNLEQIINIANNKKIKIILAGMVAPYTHGKKYKKEFDDIYPKLSKKYNLPLIPFLLGGVALNPFLNQKDGIHPNKEGTIKVSETIKKSIINILN